MKIGIVCYPTYGGSGVVASELGVGMAERGHEIHVFSYHVPFRLQFASKNIIFHKVSTSSYPLFKYPPYSLSLANELAEKTQEFDLDIIHSHYAIPHGTSALLAKQMLGNSKVKIITTLHGTDITLVGKEKSFHRITKYAMESSDGLTSVSEWLKEETLSTFHMKNCIKVIPNFIDQRDYENVKLRSYPDQKKVPLLCHISNLRPVKRPGDVVIAFSHLLKKMACKLMIVGEGPGLDELIKLAQELNVQDKIQFKGNHGDILDVLPCADVLLLPSDRESFGLVALEAMGCGIPVVGYDVGGLPEVVKNNHNGFLVPVGDTQGMSDRIFELLQDKEMLETFRQRSKVDAFAQFEMQKVLDQYEDYYRCIMNK